MLNILAKFWGALGLTIFFERWKIQGKKANMFSSENSAEIGISALFSLEKVPFCYKTAFLGFETWEKFKNIFYCKMARKLH